ncbi:MAG: acyl carrier protein [Candidatus Brocadiaceae bacterium]
MEIIAELEKFILSELAFNKDQRSIVSDEDILSMGVVDSMGIIRLVAFIEEKFGITVKDEDIVPENFQNIDSINNYIVSKITL